jgi:hypothetical protein
MDRYRMKMLTDVLLPELVQRLDPPPDPSRFIRAISEQLSSIVGLAPSTLEQAFQARLRHGLVSTPESLSWSAMPQRHGNMCASWPA